MGDRAPSFMFSLSHLFRPRTRSQNTVFASRGQYFLLELKGLLCGVDPDCERPCLVPVGEPLELETAGDFARDLDFDLNVSASDASSDVSVSSKMSNSVGRSAADKGAFTFVEPTDDGILETPFEWSIA
jgi:hypothetical protein